MLKKATVLGLMAAAAALAVPTTASAQWQDKGEPLKADAELTLTGQAKIQGEIGNIECQAFSIAQLTAGTTTSHRQLDVDNGGAANDEEKCSVGGGLTTVGCTDVEQATVSGTFGGHAVSTTTVEGTTGTVQFHLTGGIFCPKTLQLTPGTVHATLSQDIFSQGQLSGTLKLDPSMGPSQNVTVSGSGSVNPSGTYSVA